MMLSTTSLKKQIPSSAPARAALLTGKHSHINGKLTNHNRFDGSQQTFPKLLQQAGYQTAIVGKWHLGVAPTGFDFYKVINGHGSYFNCAFRETGKGSDWKKEAGYLTDVITDSAIDWLKARQKDRPFCLMVHHKAPHGPDLHKEEHARLYENATVLAPDTLHDNWKSREPLRTGECGGTMVSAPRLTSSFIFQNTVTATTGSCSISRRTQRNSSIFLASPSTAWYKKRWTSNSKHWRGRSG